MTSTLTRRGLVKASPAAVVAVSVPALASEKPDAQLLALRPKWRQAWKAYDDTFDPLAQAEGLHRARQLPMPDRDTFDGSEARYAMAVALVLQHNEKLRDEVGLTQANQRQQEACEAEWERADEVFSLPARTVKGIRFKLEVLKAREGSETEERSLSLGERQSGRLLLFEGCFLVNLDV